MSSRSDRKSASRAAFWSGCFACFYDLDRVQYLDVQVRTANINGAPVDQALISVFQAGTTNLVRQSITDRRGDAIIRIAAGNYKVRAQKAWHVPELTELDHQNLGQRAGLVVPLTMQPLQFLLHVDADRDGIVDDQTEAPINNPAPEWAWGANERGAIILCNNDNDGLPNANDPDNSDNAINAGNDATHEMAHLEIRATSNAVVPIGWTATLSVASPTGQVHPESHVRIFDGVAANDPELVGPTTAAAAAVANFAANPCSLGMEAIDYAGTGFNGIVAVRLEIGCANPLGGGPLAYYTEAQMRVAPWLMPTHMDRPDQVFVVDAGNGNQAFRNGLTGFVNAAQDANGNAPALQPYDDVRNPYVMRDVWMQDCMEIGYSNFPGHGDGTRPVRIDSFMMAHRNRGPFDLKGYPLSKLAIQIGHTNPDQADLFTALTPVGIGPAPAEGPTSLVLQGLGVILADADAIAQAGRANLNVNDVGDTARAVAEAAAESATQRFGAGVAAAVSVPVGVAAAMAAVSDCNGGLNYANVYAQALAQAGGNAAAAQRASFAAAAIVGILNDPNFAQAAGQLAAVAVAPHAGVAAPVTAGADAIQVLLRLQQAAQFQRIDQMTLFEASPVAYAVAAASGVNAANAYRVSRDATLCVYYLLDAAYAQNTTYDSNGNLEVTPPVKASANAHGHTQAKDYRWGRIYYGGGPNVGDFDPGTLNFLNGQVVQKPFALNTNWLFVGHVDEMMTFLPARDANRPAHKQWRLLIASPHEAYEVLRNAAPGAAVAMPNKHLDFEGHPNTAVQVTATDLLGNLPSYIPNPNPAVGGMIGWNDLRAWNEGPVQDVIDAVVQTLVREISLDPVNDVIQVPVIFFPEDYLDDLSGNVPNDTQHNPGNGAQGGWNVFPGCNEGFLAGALTADMVNMLVLNNHLIIPDPFGPTNPVGTNPVGRDHFKHDLEQKLQVLNNALQPADRLQWNFLDDWSCYHAQKGEIHCGTNTLRRPRPADVNAWLATQQARWWEFPGP